MNSNIIDAYPLPLNGLRHFYWAAKLESFKKAAKALHVSEAAISQQIRNLESSLKVKLFNRGHQKVSLTVKGKRLFPFVQTAFINFHEGINTIAADPDPNRLTLSTVPSLATNWLIKRLIYFNQLHPDLSISIDTSIGLIDFEESSLDLAIRYGPGNYPGLKKELLMCDPIIIVCRPELVTNGVITREDILRLPAIIGTAEGVQHTLNEYKDFYQFDADSLKASLVLRDGSFGVEAVRSGQGFAFQRISLVIDLLMSGELTYATDFASRTHCFYAVAPESHFKNPKVIKFLTWLKSEMDITAEKIAPYVAKIKHWR